MKVERSRSRLRLREYGINQKYNKMKKNKQLLLIDLNGTVRKFNK
jgi:hypothetical protein